MTISQYLEIKRKENPQFSHYGDSHLYETLRPIDKNMPSWTAVDASIQNRKKFKSPLEKEVNPGFVNGLFEWTDWSIDETDPNWVKNAYNSSVTGLAYQLWNEGEQKYTIDEGWNPGIMEDIGSMVLSFAMPLDLLAMRVGTVAAKGALSTTAGARGVQTKAINTLVSKGYSKADAARTVKNILSGETAKEIGTGIIGRQLAKAQIVQAAAPRIYGSIIQGGTLATFSGAHAGLEAANNGEDTEGIWKAIGGGVAHGGIMGGLAGFAGASLNIQHAKIFAKSKDQGLSIAERIAAAVKGNAEQAKLLATGVPGQLVTEAAIFTLPSVHMAITDEHYKAENVFRDFVVNIGMMGILKAQHKIFGEGKEIALEHVRRVLGEKKKEKDLTKDSFDKVDEALDEGINASENPTQHGISSKGGNAAGKYMQESLKTQEKTIEQFNKHEDKIKKLEADVEEYGKGLNIDEIKTPELVEMVEALREIRTHMESNFNYHSVDVRGKKEQLKRIQEAMDIWDNKIDKPLNDFKNARQGAAFKTSEITSLRVRLGNAIKKEYDKGNTNAVETLKSGNESFIEVDNKGNVKIDPANVNEVKWGRVKENLKGYEVDTDITRRDLKDKGISESVVDKIEGTKEQLKFQPESSEFQERIDFLKDAIFKETDISKKEPLQEELLLLEASKEIRDRQLPEDKGAENYRQSKSFLHYLAQKIFPGHTTRDITLVDKSGYLKRLDKIVQWVAEKRNKSIFEITDKDILAYFEAGKAKSHANDWAFLVQRLKEAGMSSAKVGALKVTTKKTIENLFAGKEALKGKRGPRTAVREGMETYWKFGDNVIDYIQPKKGSLVGRIKKYVTTKLGKVLKKLSKDTSGPEGHNDFLFKDIIKHAINDRTFLDMVKHYMGTKNIPEGRAGEHRAFRYAFEQWAVKKYGGNSKESKEVLKVVLGDASPETMIERYGSQTYYNEYVPRAKELVKEYLADIEQGYFHEKGLKENPIVKIDKKFEKNEAGYNVNELKIGLEKLEKDIKNKKKIKYNGQEISPEVARAMFQYAIQTAPRINEIAPKQEVINKRIKDAKAEREAKAKEATETSKKNQFQLESAEDIISAEELINQQQWAESKHKDLTVNVEKDLGKFNGKYVLGKLVDKVVKLAEGKTRKDTLPHEVSHDVVNVLKSVGSKFSKKLVERGINLFKPDAMKNKDTAYGAYAESRKKDVKKLTAKEKREAINEYAEELLVDALGKYTANRIKNKTMLSKMKYWVSNVVSYFRQLFGIHNPNDVMRMKADIVNILGEKVFKGKKPTDYMGSADALKAQYQTGETKNGHKNLVKADTDVRETIKGLKENYKVDSKLIDSIIKDELGVSSWEIKKGAKNDVSLNQLWNLHSKLESLVNRPDVKNLTDKQKNNLARNESFVLKVEKTHGINEHQRNKWFKDNYNVSFENATVGQVEYYRSQVLQGPKTPLSHTAAVDYTEPFKADEMPKWGHLARPLMTVGGVLRKWGGEFGRKVSRALDQHDYVSSVIYHGEAQVHLERIAKIVDRKTQKDYMHLIDAELAKEAKKSLKRLIKENPNNSKYVKELKEVERISEKFEKGDYIEARKIWHNLTEWYWEHLITEVNKHTNPAEFKEIMGKINKLYVKNYFARRVRPEVLKHLDVKSPAIDRLAKEIVRDMSKKELKEAADKLAEQKKFNIKKGDKNYNEILKGEGKFLIDIVANEIFDMQKHGPLKVKPSFLKGRGVQLPEYMEISTSKGKKTVKTYETGMDATMTSYSIGMSRFLATMRLFPEFTDFGGKFSLDTGKKAGIIKKMRDDKGMGSYALMAIERQLGVMDSRAEILNEPWLLGASHVTNISAAIGLSSPTSGIKNFFIQIPRNMALYGVRNTTRALSRGATIYFDPKLYEQAIREGQIGYGTKVIFEESATVGRGIKWWFNNVNGMMKSENFNRIVSAEAAKMQFNELTNKLRNRPSLFHPNAKTGDVHRYLKEMYRLEDKQIDWLINEPNIDGTSKLHKLQEWVGFQGHKRAAGATGVADLPMWFSNKYSKPLTLFTRIAASVTIDSFNNYVKPMRYGNFAPMVKATIGHGLAGAALYAMYDTIIGQQPPKEESPFIDRAMANIWRGEMLGVWGEILNPYQKEHSMPIMEPVIIRNAQLAWENITQAIKYQKTWDDALKDMALKSIVILGQGDRILTNIKHPYVNGYKRMRVLERNFNIDYGYPVSDAQFEKTKRSPYYWKLKKAIMLGKSDKEIAQTYYAAYNYILHELETVYKVKSKAKRIKKARQALDASIRMMKPIMATKKRDGRKTSKYQELLNSLSLSNKKLADDLMKTYYVKERNLRRILKNKDYFNANALY